MLLDSRTTTASTSVSPLLLTRKRASPSLSLAESFNASSVTVGTVWIDVKRSIHTLYIDTKLSRRDLHQVRLCQTFQNYC